MTERPILFSAEMVRAILEGRKTQTRRVIKPVPTFNKKGACHDADALQQDYVEPYWVFPETCKYGAPGDLLWVREKCRAEELSRPPTTRTATAKERRLTGRTQVLILDDLDGVDGVRYDADNEWRRIENTQSAGDAWDELYHYNWRQKCERRGGWVPSIHMPRWASRITLEVKSVRVERLQDISEDDARAEGCQARPFPWSWWEGYRDLGDGQLFHQQAVGGTPPDWMIEPKRMPPKPWLDRSAIDDFRSIWMGLHGPSAWDADPWVWVLSFERVKP